MSQTSNLLDIAPFLRAVPHNLGRFQSTVIEQVGQSSLAIVRKHRSEGFPDAEAHTLIFHLWPPSSPGCGNGTSLGRE